LSAPSLEGRARSEVALKYLALLRGINVGGNNLINMADLRQCLEDTGFNKVSTYIQSGNVLFESSARDPARVAGKMERALSARFGYTALVVLLSEEELEAVIEGAPEHFGTDPESYRYDVIFLRSPFQAPEVLPTVKLKPGVDEAFANQHAIYCWRLISKASQSSLPKLIAHPAYKSMTIRNWNTTSKLHQLITAI
jgi:uncharacterized protein (DUF1697 family)